MENDLYAVLGVSKDADEKEIKKAYRQLVKQHHPDTSSAEDKQGNEERMKEINAAYSILSDSEKRQRYDMGGMGNLHGNDFGAGFTTFDFRDIFGSEMFEQVFRNRSQHTNAMHKGSNVKVRVTRDLSASWQKEKRTIDYKQHINCSACQGSGAAETATCSACNGNGYQQSEQRQHGLFISHRSACFRCGGSGKHVVKECNECNGAGYQTQDHSVTADIPKGVINNILVMEGEGNLDSASDMPGDLIIEVIAEIPDGYVITENMMIGAMLSYNMSISLTTALLGGDEEFQHINGELINVPINTGTKDGDTLIVEKQGLPAINAGENGALQIHFKIDIPDNLNSEQIELLEKLRETGL